MTAPKHVLKAVDEELTREALERYPGFGVKLPHHDFSKPDNYDIGVSRVDEAQVCKRSQVPDCADVYEGYVPIDRLHPVLAEEEAADVQCECLDCGYVDNQEAFNHCSQCPECGSKSVAKAESGYDWESFTHRGTFPVAEVFISNAGDTLVTDGNHRVTHWQEQGMTHAPAWVIDERPCAPKKRRQRRV